MPLRFPTALLPAALSRRCVALAFAGGLGLWLEACHCGAGAPSEGNPAAPHRAEAPDETPPATADDVARPAQAPGAAARDAFAVEVHAVTERRSTTVSVRATGSARVSSHVVIERVTALDERGGARESEPVGALSLRPSCDVAAPECVSLAVGAELLPPPWRGVGGDGQCTCSPCAWPAPGTYRFVVKACDGERRVASGPFVVEPL